MSNISQNTYYLQVKILHLLSLQLEDEYSNQDVTMHEPSPYVLSEFCQLHIHLLLAIIKFHHFRVKCFTLHER